MKLERAGALAAAVMTTPAPEARCRWIFGVLAPRAWSESGGSEAWWLEAQLLVAGRPRRVAAQLRFVQLAHHAADGVDRPIVRTVELEIPDGTGEQRFAFDELDDPALESYRLSGRLWLRREAMVADHPLQRITIHVDNLTPFHERNAPRERALYASFASTHLLVGVEGATLLSAFDPPAWARAASTCRCTRTYPVLVTPSDDVALCAPFLLQDHPRLTHAGHAHFHGDEVDPP
jgi:hypothetical protein